MLLKIIDKKILRKNQAYTFLDSCGANLFESAFLIWFFKIDDEKLNKKSRVAGLHSIMNRYKEEYRSNDDKI